MAILGFYIGGVSTTVLGATNSSVFAHILVATKVPDRENTYYAQSVGALNHKGDTGFGKLKNKILSYGWISCNTKEGGIFLGQDSSNRVLPLHLAGRYIEIKVDSGATFSGLRKTAVTFKVIERYRDGNKGKTLFEFDGIVPIWSGRMSSDASISGMFQPITGKARIEVAKQIITNHAKNL